ncbi:putative reverse transcriptase domain-containing protein [Tanacetum coccineum]
MEDICPSEEIQRLENELRSLNLRDTNIAAYTQRFNELALLCPEAVPSEKKKVELYIKGLPENIKGETTSSKPVVLNDAVRMAHTLMEQKIQDKAERVAENNKRKWESNNNQSGNNNNRNNYRDNTRHYQHNNKRQRNARAITTTLTEQGGYAGNKPFCNRCKKHHTGYCTVVCSNYGRTGHMARDCKSKAVATGANAQPILTCYECGEKGHTRNHCPKRNNPQGELGTFDIVIGMDWLVELDAVIVANCDLEDVPVKFECPEVFSYDLPAFRHLNRVRDVSIQQSSCQIKDSFAQLIAQGAFNFDLLRRGWVLPACASITVELEHVDGQELIFQSNVPRNETYLTNFKLLGQKILSYTAMRQSKVLEQFNAKGEGDRICLATIKEA